MLPTLKAGLFGIGLDAYWPQFSGLKERLEDNIGAVARRLARPGVEVVNLGLIDNSGKAFAAGRQFRQADVDIIFLYVTTYALSATVLPVVQRAKVPVIILNLQPTAAIDYPRFNALNDRVKMTGEWLAYCSACPVPEIANVFRRAGIQFHQVTGILGHDPVCWNEVDGWIAAARTMAVLRENRLGLMGHYYGGMLDIYTDVNAICATFGGHAEIIEVDELTALRRDVGNAEIVARRADFTREFTVEADCATESLDHAAKTSAALDALVKKYELGSLAYYYKGSGVAENEVTMASIILGTSWLTGRGIPVAGEYEVKNVIAMKIMDLLGCGGSFTEFYAMDFNDDIVLMGHDGPGHIGIANGRVRVRPLKVYHGKVGNGVSVEMAVRHGPVTLLSVVENPGKGYSLLVAEGESVAGPILEIGNTNSRYRFSPGARAFAERWNERGPAHHCAVGVGHQAATLRKLAQLLGLELHQVC